MPAALTFFWSLSLFRFFKLLNQKGLLLWIPFYRWSGF